MFVEYKLGRLNVVANALSRRPNFESGAQFNSEGMLTVAKLSASVPSSSLLDDVRKAYAEDGDLQLLMDHLLNPSRNLLKDLSVCTDLHRIGIQHPTSFCITHPLMGTRLGSLSLHNMNCACALFMNVTMP